MKGYVKQKLRAEDVTEPGPVTANSCCCPAGVVFGERGLDGHVDLTQTEAPLLGFTAALTQGRPACLSQLRLGKAGQPSGAVVAVTRQFLPLRL